MSKVCPECGEPPSDERLVMCHVCKVSFVEEGRQQTQLSEAQLRNVANHILKSGRFWIFLSIGVIAIVWAVLQVVDYFAGRKVQTQIDQIQARASNSLARAEVAMFNTITRRFEEPRIKQIVQDVAATQATNIMLLQLQPEVTRFKSEIAARLVELQALVAKTKSLEEQSQEHRKAIESVLTSLNQTLHESQATRDKIVGLQSDVVKMQKCASRIQYFTLKGANKFPNPYKTNIVESLNEMLSIAIPDPAERSKFIMELGGPKL